MAKKNEGMTREVIVPEGINVELGENRITLIKDSKRIERKVSPVVKISKQGDKVVLKIETTRRVQKKEIGTYEGHIKNMIEGLTNGFKYELEICNVHFPMTVTFDKAKKEIIVKNLLGEKAPRILHVPESVEVEIKAPKITIKSFDIENAGNIATELEKMTKIRNRDRNKFQDGIFITKKPGKDYL